MGLRRRCRRNPSFHRCTLTGMRTLPVIVFVLASLGASGQSADELQKALAAESKTLDAWASDKTVIEAVRQRNAKRVSLDDVKRIDAEWTAGRADANVREATTGACADRLRALAAQSPRYGETFVMDANGAVVCATQRTSDYWQGDEAKWSRAFTGGAVFIDRPKLDDSSKSRLAQISLPIVDGGKTIGVLTVGVHIDKLK